MMLADRETVYVQDGTTLKNCKFHLSILIKALAPKFQKRRKLIVFKVTPKFRFKIATNLTH